MKVEIIDSSIELRKVAQAKLLSPGTCVFIDIQYDYMFLSHIDGQNINSIAVRLMDKTNQISISEVGKLISTVTLILKSNPVLITNDIKNTIKNYDKLCKVCCNSEIWDPFNNGFILDSKIFSGVFGAGIEDAYQNFCDFETYVKSCAEVLKKIVAYSRNVTDFYKNSILDKSSYCINLRAIPAVLDMEGMNIRIVNNGAVIKDLEPYFSLNGTYTGRTTSNTHAISKDHRKLIEVEKDNSLYCFDYESGEVRVMASLAGDEKLIKLFESDKDIYEELIKALDAEDKIERKSAKNAFLSIMNGITISGLEKNLKVNKELAKAIIQGAKKLAPKSFQFLDKIREEAVDPQKANDLVFVNQLTQRQFQINKKEFKNDWEKKTVAVSFYLQGTLSDVKLVALTNIKKILDEFNKENAGVRKAFLRFEIHDAVFVEVPTSNFDELLLNKLLNDIKSAMEIIPGGYMGENKCKLKVNITKVK